MKNVKPWKIFIVVLCSLLLIALFATLCFYTYKLHWNKHAFWWPWVVALFIVDFTTVWIIFHNKNKSDENKSFWLFILLIAPFVGFFMFIAFGRSGNTQEGSHPNNALLLENIFNAKKSITICANVFFPPYDIFAALNFASNSNKTITLIVNYQRKKYIHELMHLRFEKQLSRSIKIYFTNADILQSFMIIDDERVLLPHKNFNYKNIFDDKPIAMCDDAKRYVESAKAYLKNATFDQCEVQKRPPYKRLILSLANIFYINL